METFSIEQVFSTTPQDGTQILLLSAIFKSFISSVIYRETAIMCNTPSPLPPPNKTFVSPNSILIFLSYNGKF